MGQIALIAADTAFIGAALMLILSILGVVHLRRAAPEAEVFPRIATRVEVSATCTSPRQPSGCRSDGAADCDLRP
jgi:hypothetical protein